MWRTPTTHPGWSSRAPRSAEEEPDPKVPWHFWLLIIATVVIYLG